MAIFHSHVSHYQRVNMAMDSMALPVGRQIISLQVPHGAMALSKLGRRDSSNEGFSKTFCVTWAIVGHLLVAYVGFPNRARAGWFCEDFTQGGIWWDGWWMTDEGRIQTHFFGIITNLNKHLLVAGCWFHTSQAPKNLKVTYHHPRISRVKINTQLSNELLVSSEQGMTKWMKADWDPQSDLNLNSSKSSANLEYWA